MDDRLRWLLETFELRANVFQAGPLCGRAVYGEEDNRGYIHILKAGRLTIEFSEQSFLFEEPTLIFFMNPIGHWLTPHDGAISVCASFEFGGTLGNPLARALPEMFSLKLADAPSLAKSLGLLFDEAREKHCGYQVVLNRMMEIVIIGLLRDLMDSNRLELGLLAGLADSKLTKAINAMHAHPESDWTLDRLAEQAGMSRARFAKRFHDIVGTTPLAYLSEWRIGLAKSLLSRGKTLEQTAFSVGYSGASTLSRAFSAFVGESPKSWLDGRGKKS
ncbi:AraC family transcriptional regulator [Thiobacillus sp.]|uniref:AraC family transcriptional regulator n=1 Tax=Thiobacillus sp. TaxID=924 RepID=UPI0011D54B94|nr:AraC family transcriptional regulator [Thiobacillus sp.]TXH75735.1 MAG: AraC family transcriptional regulator [Thiobacillus sp.]